MSDRLVLVLLALILLSGCSDGEVRKKTPPPQRPTPALRLLVLTDLAGNLEPCGCTSRPLGGIDRMAAAVKDARKDGVPTLLVHAGDLFYGPGPHSATTALPPQEVFKAETVAEVLDRISVGAATPGARDLSHGAGRFLDLVGRSDFPLLGAGLHAERVGPGEAPPRDADLAMPAPEAAPIESRSLAGGVVKKAGGRAVGIVGVMFPDAGLPWPDGVKGPADPLAAAEAAAKRVRAEGADLVVALVDGTRRDAREVARAVPADFVVMGGVDEDTPIAPTPAAGGALLLHAGRHGQGLLVVDVWPRGKGDWQDVGELGRAATRQRLDGRIDELETRIAQWADDDSVSADDVSRQRMRLEALKKERRALDTPPPLPKGNAVAARYVELPPEAPRDPAISKLLDRFFKKVNQHNREAYADVTPPPVPEGEAGYVGSEACASCHTTEYAWWRHTKHGHAYATLAKRHKQFNLDCVGCHVTGYGKPGGSTVTHVDGLENVGCENCHGPGSLHVKDPKNAAVDVHAEAPERICVGCHNEEHSDLFDYRAYRNILIMPGHGLPARTGS